QRGPAALCPASQRRGALLNCVKSMIAANHKKTKQCPRLPLPLLKLLAAGQEKLAAEEAARQRVEQARQAAAQAQARTSWQNLVAAATSDLGPDLVKFVTWVTPED